MIYNSITETAESSPYLFSILLDPCLNAPVQAYLLYNLPIFHIYHITSKNAMPLKSGEVPGFTNLVTIITFIIYFIFYQ